jgi:hypothetical protein
MVTRSGRPVPGWHIVLAALQQGRGSGAPSKPERLTDGLLDLARGVCGVVSSWLIWRTPDGANTDMALKNTYYGVLGTGADHFASSSMKNVPLTPAASSLIQTHGQDRRRSIERMKA